MNAGVRHPSRVLHTLPSSLDIHTGPKHAIARSVRMATSSSIQREKWRGGRIDAKAGVSSVRETLVAADAKLCERERHRSGNSFHGILEMTLFAQQSLDSSFAASQGDGTECDSRQPTESIRPSTQLRQPSIPTDKSVRGFEVAVDSRVRVEIRHRTSDSG
jgi:hypothetical protein